MPDNSMSIYELRLRKLEQTDSWSEVHELIDYFLTHDAERRQVTGSAVAQAMLDLALHESILIQKEAMSGLVRLERWWEIGQLVRIWIDPEKELKHRYSRHASRLRNACMFNLTAVDPVKWALQDALQGVDTRELWPEARNYFRRKDEAIRCRAIRIIGELHIAPAYLTLKRLIENPEQSALHCDTISALGGIGDNKAVRYLISLLDEPARQLDALYALQLAASPKAVSALKKLLETSPAAKIQVECIDALGKSKVDTAARVLLKYAEGPYKYHVIIALGETGSDVAVPRLKRFLRGRNSVDRERELAAEALSEIDTPASRRVLAETLSGGNKKAASYAGTVLRSRQDDQSW